MKINDVNEWENVAEVTEKPLAPNIPYNVLQNKENTANELTYGNYNFQDFLTLGYEDITQAANAQEVINTTLNVTAAILNFLGVPYAGTVISLYQKLFNYLWPYEDTSEWDKMMTAVEALVNQKINETVRSLALGDLKGLGGNLKSYGNALKDWNENKNDADSTALVLSRFRTVNEIFVNDMASFAAPGYEVLLLDVYAKAANLHLLLLRDAELYGADWGMPEDEINLFYKEQEDYRREYSDHCISWYQKGLNQLNKSSALDWIKYNRYRTQMTINVLDFVALYPNYDVRKYPMSTHTEFTRTVYSDPIGYDEQNGTGTSGIRAWYEAGRSFAEIENNVIPAPDIVKFIDKLTVYSKRINASPFMATRWAGHSITFDSKFIGTQNEIRYGDVSGAPTTFSFKDTDIYRTISTVGTYYYTNGPYKLPLSKVNFYGINTSDQKKMFYYDQDINFAFQHQKDSSKEIAIVDPGPTVYGDYNKYSHRLSYISDAPIKPLTGLSSNEGFVPVFGWMHSSTTRENVLSTDKITQVPAAKTLWIGGLTTMVSSNGYCGGDILKNSTMSNGFYGGAIAISCEDYSQQFRIRVRYASTTSGRLTLSNIETVGGPQVILERTMKKDDSIQYSNFRYTDYSRAVTFTPDRSLDYTRLQLEFTNVPSGEIIYIDKIEFIPVTQSELDKEALETAQEAVHALFIDGTQNLKTEMTDHHINQVSMIVDCVSEELYSNEKRNLLYLVKHAKRQSTTRNLILDSNFISINSEDVNAWYGSPGLIVESGDAVFKENYVHLRGPNDERYPTYLYQKIDESKLTEYTRYQLRGFIEGSRDLEVYVIRYDAKHETLNVLEDLSLDNLSYNECGQPDRCLQEPYIEQRLQQEEVDNEHACHFDSNDYLSSSNEYPSDSHHLSLHVDTGSIDFKENLGIWILFKLSTTDGYAKIGNIELVEEGPLTGRALGSVKRMENKWKEKVESLRLQGKKAYDIAKLYINNLFEDPQNTKLYPFVTFLTLSNVRQLVNKIYNKYSPWLSLIPGVNYDLFEELAVRFQNALQLYDTRNLIKNGRFIDGLVSWMTTPGVQVRKDSSSFILELNSWEEQVVQKVPVCQGHGYVLRVTASKEDLGDGYIKVSDEMGNSDTIIFSACNNSSNDSSIDNYVTQELEFFPDSHYVHLEIGETEGTFQIVSVELILMED
ncbi:MULTISPECIES: insecticidal delta-endotoxin Cry8Ea1 family protein [Bacillus cereus group]|uniref:insecticidal delta-endotoxin Cry8Ea1 family protein n=1 Tax=Bacillus cereus group TaxID=86661 RepID=UPI00124EF09B|nr:insecticidal delta-endotoxin Cry8Ea1 family protein [Bacillus cereus]KAB2421876.1 pesticidal protein [Bacillus cereus]